MWNISTFLALFSIIDSWYFVVNFELYEKCVRSCAALRPTLHAETTKTMCWLCHRRPLYERAVCKVIRIPGCVPHTHGISRVGRGAWRYVDIKFSPLPLTHTRTQNLVWVPWCDSRNRASQYPIDRSCLMAEKSRQSASRIARHKKTKTG